MTVHAITIESPIGAVRLFADGEALVAATLPAQPPPPCAAQALEAGPGGGDHPVLARAARQLQEYFAGERETFDLPLAPHGTEFQRAVWSALTAIPFGATRSYGELAATLGRPTASRAVGAANGQNPLAILVPCHRVVGASGALTGYAGGLAAKEWLLRHEQRGRAAGAPSRS